MTGEHFGNFAQDILRTVQAGRPIRISVPVPSLEILEQMPERLGLLLLEENTPERPDTIVFITPAPQILDEDNEQEQAGTGLFARVLLWGHIDKTSYLLSWKKEQGDGAYGYPFGKVEDFPQYRDLWQQICDVIAERNRLLGFTPPEGVFPTPNEGKRTPASKNRLNLPGTLHRYTFPEVREVHRAIGDGQSLTEWSKVTGEFALRHAIPGQTLQTKLSPSPRLMRFRDWLDKRSDELSLDALCQELRSFDFDANILFSVCLSLAIERTSFTVTLDELAVAIGWDARSRQAREDNRLKIWLWLLLFDSLQVIGMRRGKFKDPYTKKLRDMESEDDLLHIAGTRGPTQGQLDGMAEEVTLQLGPWAEQFRGDKSILTHLGDIRSLASKPRGKAAQRIAVKVGLSLLQQFREKATHRETDAYYTGEENRLTIRYEDFTRQSLLTTYGQEPLQEVVDLLGGKDPRFAAQYWNDAIGLLKKWGVVGFYKELDPLPDNRKGWKEFWLKEQRLDIRPAKTLAPDVQEVMQAKKRADTVRKRRQPAKGSRITPELPE